MSASKEFNRLFTAQALTSVYESSIKYRTTVGIDKISRSTFETNLTINIKIIRTKCRNGSYKFSQYREKLITRGANRNPRVVSIPTIRDKVVLKALNDLLEKKYKNSSPYLHQIISEISHLIQTNTFDSFLRLDVKDFYPSIKHQILFDTLKRKIRKKEILKLLQSAISQDTVSKPSSRTKKFHDIGVPQGLSISNKLANIYMQDIDRKYGKKTYLKYFRFVDDILILCNQKRTTKIFNNLKLDCEQIGLNIHKMNEDSAKTSIGLIKDGFSYLGYSFTPPTITVRKKSIEHLRDKIIRIFTSYKFSRTKNMSHLKWNLDLRISGCIFNSTKYGWLFFFSQINDMTLLHSLDQFVKKQLPRFVENPSHLKIKKFVRAYHEITKNLANTNYIPNFDTITIDERRKILDEVFGVKGPLTQSQVIYNFNKRIYRTIRDLEQDMARAS